MCGLTGFWEPGATNSREQLETTVTKMADTLYKRGPDSSGVWCDPECGIAMGHRRLAIIDLSTAGHQPMVSASGRTVISFNGVIYNYQELRKELESAGIKFRGSSDTEVLLEACELWGVINTTKRLIGMFAFVVWDGQQLKLTLVRDRLGKKPLYWGWQGDTFFFGSECKSFSPHPSWRPAINRSAVAVFLRYSYISAPLSIYQNIKQMRPGHIVTVRADRGIQETCYWNVREIAENCIRNRTELNEQDVVDHLDSLLRDAISHRMIADVPLGAFLSGGIDSSTVVALMQAVSNQPVRTFSIGFHEKHYNEASHALAVARHLGTDHTEFYVEPGHALNLVPKLAEYYDEPFADSSQLPTLLVSELARYDVTVALSGDGGDELFAGYNRYMIARRLDHFFSVMPAMMRTGIASCLRGISPLMWNRIIALLPKPRSMSIDGGKIHRLANILPVKDFEQASRVLISQWPIDAELTPGEGAGLDVLNGELLPDAVEDVIERLQLIDQISYLPGDILTKVDRASMAYSLELRGPLLDHRVVEFAWSLPHSYKLRNGISKWCLRQVLYRYVPRNLIERPKMGFGVPIGEWLRGPLREWAEELLSEHALAQDNLYNVPLVRRYWDEHQRGVCNWQYALWNVLMAQAWQARWMH